MRLLFVHERFGAFGGAEANVLVTAAELKRRGHSVGLLHGAHTGKEEAAWEDVFETRFPINAPASSRSAFQAMSGFQPDAVFLHKLADLEILKFFAESPVPVVRMVHDHDLYCLRGYKYNPFTRGICTRRASAFCVFPCGGTVARDPGSRFPVKWVNYGRKRRELEISRRFRRLIVATEFMRTELVRNGFPPDRIEIHAPVPRSTHPQFQPDFSDRNRIVYAGQLIRGKGVDVLLESLSRVQSRFECLILGDGNHRAFCERLTDRLGLRGRVLFSGFVPQDAVTESYRSASLAVMSSVWPEPFGAVGLEAMRSGLPVVAFDAGGIREWLADGWNGFLVPWMDRARYAASIDALLGNKDLARKMGAQARQWADERFGFSNYIDGLENLFARTAAPDRATSPLADQPASP